MNYSSPPLEEPNVADFLRDKNSERVSTLTPFLIYLVLLMLFGLVGNTLAFVVYYSRFKPSSSRTYVLSMSLCDLLTNSVALVTEIVDVSITYTYAAWFCKLSKVLMGILVLFSGLVLVVVAMDRQKVVCGMYTRNKPVDKKVLGAICSCGGLAVLLSVPRAVLYGNHTATFNETNITGVQCNIEDAYLHSLFPVIYNGLHFLLFVGIIVIMAVCYGRVGVHLWRHKQRTSEQFRRASSATGSSNNNARIEIVRRSQKDASHLQNDDLNTDLKEPSFSSVFENPPSSTTQPTPTQPSQPSIHFQRQLSTMSGTKSNGTRTGKLSTTSSNGSGTVSMHLSSAVVSAVQKTIPSRTTLMLFVLTALFVLNFLPYLTMEVLLAVAPHSPVWQTNLNVLFLLLRSYYINSVINPVVYSFCSARFRQQCCHLFRKLWGRCVKAVN